MTDSERRIKTRMAEDEYAEKFHRLDAEECMAHINRDSQQLREINDKRVRIGVEMELEKRMLDY